jgi:solute:Na+ symporter, SSS family
MVSASIALLVLFVTLAFIAWVGFRARHHGGNLEDYIVARNSQGAAALGLSLLASGMGAWILFAPPEVGAFIGFVGVLGYALGAAAPLVAFALVGERIRRVIPAGHSLTEFVRLRFGRTFHVYVVGITILYMLVYVTAELTAIGAITAIISGLDSRIVIVAVAAVTVAYTAYGGLRASLRTDRWQAWIVLALLTLAAVALVVALDSPRDALADSGRFTVERVGIEAALTLIIAITAANLFHQGYWQRVWAARDRDALRGGIALGVALTIPVILIVGVLGIMAAGAGLELGSPPAPFFALMAGLPDWVAVAVFILGIMLVASTVDTLASGLASLAVVERPSLSLGTAQVVTVLLVVPAVFVAIQGYSVLRLLLIADLFCATAIVPALLSIWRRATAAGALAGAVAGLAGAVVPGVVSTGSLAEGIERATFPGAIPTLPPFLGALIASTAVAVVVSLAGRRQTDVERINERLGALPGSSGGAPR